MECEIGFSNPCFELWYYLHFNDQAAEIDAKGILKKLKGETNYRKNKNDMYSELKEKQNDAITRARNLRRIHTRNGKDKKANPSTTVDIIVEQIKTIFSRP